MSNINNINKLTKEQLLACLEHDGIEVNEDTINEAKNNDGGTFFDIGLKYHETEKDYSKAMAWYRLAANQNYSGAYSNIGVLYCEGLGVSRDYHIALEYYLKAAENYHNIAMGNIGYQFLFGKGVPVDKYKALEWYIKCGNRPEQVKRLNDKDVHLKEEDKNKTIHQLIIEAEDIIRQERKKKEMGYQELKKLNAANEKELTKLRKDHQKLQNESQQKQQRINTLEQKEQQLQLRMDLLEQKEQQTINEKELLKQLNGSLDQQLKDKIEASKQAFQLFELLVESKNNEIGLLKNNIQRPGNLEQEYHDLKRRLESLSSIDSNNTINDSNNNDTPSNTISHDTTNNTIKSEENEHTPCQVGNKKRRIDS